MNSADEQYKKQQDAATDLLESELAVEMMKIHYAFAKPSFALSRWLLVVTGAVVAALLANATAAAGFLGRGSLLGIIVLLVLAGFFGLVAVYLELIVEARVAALTALPIYGNATVAKIQEYQANLKKYADFLGLSTQPPLALPDQERIAKRFETPKTWLARLVFGSVDSDDDAGLYRGIIQMFYRQAIASRLQLLLVVFVFGVGLVDIGVQNARALFPLPIAERTAVPQPVAPPGQRQTKPGGNN